MLGEQLGPQLQCAQLEPNAASDPGTESWIDTWLLVLAVNPTLPVVLLTLVVKFLIYPDYEFGGCKAGP